MQCDSGAPFYEFFAGGGLARLGLAPDFSCVFANDIDHAKARAYRTAFPEAPMHEGDVWRLAPTDLPGQAALAWASFPCQDLAPADSCPSRSPVGAAPDHRRSALDLFAVLPHFKLHAVQLRIQPAESYVQHRKKFDLTQRVRRR